MPIPAIVGAAIITGAAGTAATVYGAKQSSKANRLANEAEERALDKQLAFNREANDATLAYEKDLENRRRYEWDREQSDQQAQWDWYQNALAPYRSASAGALGSLAAMVQNLGGVPLNLGAQNFSLPAGAGGSSSWTPSDMVRTASSAPRLQTSARAPQFSTMPVGDASRGIVQAGAVIADLLKSMPSGTRQIMANLGGEDI